MNRESAYEMLAKRTAQVQGAAQERGAAAQPGAGAAAPKAEGGSRLSDMLWGTTRRQGMVESMAKQAARTVGSQIGRQVLRGVMGGLLGVWRRR